MTLQEAIETIRELAPWLSKDFRDCDLFDADRDALAVVLQAVADGRLVEAPFAFLATVNGDMAALRAENDALRARAEKAERAFAEAVVLAAQAQMGAEAAEARLAPIEALARENALLSAERDGLIARVAAAEMGNAALRAENAALRAALESLTFTLASILDAFPAETVDAWGGGNTDDLWDALERARAALRNGAAAIIAAGGGE